MILVNKCIEENLKVCPIPGPSAVTAAVSVSGFASPYLFYGFLTKKENELEKVLKSLNFYLTKFKNFFFNRKIFIAREMTKLHEDFLRKDVISIKNLPKNLKGELTVVISEKNKEKNIPSIINESVKIEINKMLKKYSHKDVVEFISKKENLPKKLVYNFCLRSKNEK